MSGTATFRVAGMTCAHCVSSVTEELTGIDGVLGVEVALESGEVTVTSTAPLERAAVEAAVTEAGYALG
ncbi:MAG: heavy metal transporter [Nocardioides sp.]|jgi:copper chaperone|nr:heavy metal transporter [Nocardioides sp.]